MKDRIKKVFTDDLPKWEKGANKGKFDWMKCAEIKAKIKFVYDDVEGEVEIVDYKSKGQYLSIKYLDKEPFRIRIKDFIKCQLGRLLGTYIGEFRVKIGQTFKDDNRDITIIDRKIIKDKNGKKWKAYKYRCNKCGFECEEHYSLKNKEYKEECWINEYNLLRGNRCACCCIPSRIVVPKINDIPTTAPWMIKYFQGGYDEAKLYNKNSHHFIYPICPDCGRIKDKSVSINFIYQKHSIGCICSDSISYPEKIMINILKQLNIDFKYQYTPKWCKFLFKNKQRQGKYDFYFELNNKEYIIETDGGLGHGKKIFSKETITKEESKYIDNEKDKLADEYNIQIIRIDCEKSDLEYIKNNILIKLNRIFDLSNIDWLKAEDFALSNLVKKACELKQNNPDFTTAQIGQLMNLGRTAITSYLKKGTNLGWCNYDPKDESRKNGMKNSKIFCKPVEIFKNNISLGVFESCTKLERQSEEKFGVKLNSSNISAVCNGNRRSHKGFTFKYVN